MDEGKVLARELEAVQCYCVHPTRYSIDGDLRDRILSALSAAPSEEVVEQLALNLRAYAYAMGAPRRETDEEAALGAARLILPAVYGQPPALEVQK